VEAIAQIIKQKPKAHVLVTATSNSTCDDIGNRLLKYVSINQILRIYSPSFDQKPDKIDPKLQKVSNFRNRMVCNCNKRSCPVLDTNIDPTYEEFYTARIVICTLVSCGRLNSADISPLHFDYIFIDEAASESEPQAYIPIVNLGIAHQGRINAQIVLSGDHHQLGPIITNTFAKKLGLEVRHNNVFLANTYKIIFSPTDVVDGEIDEDRPKVPAQKPRVR
jgi:helicase MOV-10